MATHGMAVPQQQWAVAVGRAARRVVGWAGRCVKSVKNDTLAVTGLACIVVGIAQWSAQWGWISAGLGLLALEVKREKP